MLIEYTICKGSQGEVNRQQWKLIYKKNSSEHSGLREYVYVFSSNQQLSYEDECVVRKSA